jgi:hypothetical protein
MVSQMTVRGMGHGLSTADKVKAIAVEYVRKRFNVKGFLEVDGMDFDGSSYRVHGHFGNREAPERFIVSLDKVGNVVEATTTM